MAVGKADDLAEELLVNLPENIGGENGKLIRAVGVIQATDNVFQGLVVYVEAKGQFIGQIAALFL